MVVSKILGEQDFFWGAPKILSGADNFGGWGTEILGESKKNFWGHQKFEGGAQLWRVPKI